MYYKVWVFSEFWTTHPPRRANVICEPPLSQRAAKLLAVKVGGHKKKSTPWPRRHLNHTANDLSLVSTDLICVKNPLTEASEFSRFWYVIL